MILLGIFIIIISLSISYYLHRYYTHPAYLAKREPLIALFALLAKFVGVGGQLTKQKIDIIQTFVIEELQVNTPSRAFVIKLVHRVNQTRTNKSFCTT